MAEPRSNWFLPPIMPHVSNGSLQRRDGKGLNDSLCWLRRDLHLLPKHHPLPSLRGRLPPGLYHAHTRDHKLPCALHLLRGHRSQDGHDLRALGLLEARLRRERLSDGALGQALHSLHGFHGDHYDKSWGLREGSTLG